MLQKEGMYNDLSPKLQEWLENRILSFGKTVRYKFDISHQDPDPEKRNTNDVVFPFQYTLQPVTFSITDKFEDRAGVQKFKKIGMVDAVDEINGRIVPSRFKRVRVAAKDKGIKKFDLTKNEDIEQVMYLELHLKLNGGEFSDNSLKQVISRIDEMAAATTARTERTERLKALNAAQAMSDKEVIEFADAMNWDSSVDVLLLREDAEALAEHNFIFFNDLVVGKTIEYQALVKQAMNKGIISFDPAEYKFLYSGNKQTITMLSPVGEKNELQKFAEFLQVGGQKADEIYKKLKALVKDTN